MIITINGIPGAGKTTLAKFLSKKLNLKHYSIGDFMRKLAKKKNITILKLNKIAEKDMSIDKEIDRMQKNIRKKNFILDSRLGFYFFPESLKIYLYVDENEAARRIFLQKRKDERNKNIKDTLRNIKKRRKSELKRYKKLYNINPDDISNYDIIMDVTKTSTWKAKKNILSIVKSFFD